MIYRLIDYDKIRWHKGHRFQTLSTIMCISYNIVICIRYKIDSKKPEIGNKTTDYIENFLYKKLTFIQLAVSLTALAVFIYSSILINQLELDPHA